MKSTQRKRQIVKLLKAIETGDPEGIKVVNPDKYIQHNPQTKEGGEGLAALFKRLAEREPKVNIVRIFSDGDYVFGHTEYHFDTSRVGFEIFRFEGDQTVEHWDNIQLRKGPNTSGRSMVDGVTEASDIEQTENNRAIVVDFVTDIIINRNLDHLARFITAGSYIEHSPKTGDDLETHLVLSNNGGSADIRYVKQHRVLADGSFVLSVCEGTIGDARTSFFDLFRLSDGKIVEHWDTTETVPPKSEWKNDNGKF